MKTKELRPWFLPGAVALLLAVGGIHAQETMKLRNLAQGQVSGIGEPRRQVVQDPVIWAQIWAKHSAGQVPKPPAPKVDFQTEMVIVVTMGTKNTGGYAIEIKRVEPAGERLKIQVQQTSPPPDALVTMALTAPFHFVAVPKIDLKPEFVEQGAQRK
jgi:hypothetical protein